MVYFNCQITVIGVTVVITSFVSSVYPKNLDRKRRATNKNLETKRIKYILDIGHSLDLSVPRINYTSPPKVPPAYGGKSPSAK